MKFVYIFYVLQQLTRKNAAFQCYYNVEWLYTHFIPEIDKKKLYW